jgi:hypothetical protein
MNLFSFLCLGRGYFSVQSHSSTGRFTRFSTTYSSSPHIFLYTNLIILEILQPYNMYCSPRTCSNWGPVTKILTSILYSAIDIQCRANIERYNTIQIYCNKMQCKYRYDTIQYNIQYHTNTYNAAYNTMKFRWSFREKLAQHGFVDMCKPYIRTVTLYVQ